MKTNRKTSALCLRAGAVAAALGVLLWVFTGFQINAQTATNIPGVFPNTNVVRSFPIGFAQGTCNNGTNVYVDLTTLIQWHSTNYGPIMGGIYASSGITNGLADYFPKIHLGDPDCYQGCLYVPLESDVGAPQGAAIIDVAIFNTPAMTRCAAISISNYQAEASAVCVDPDLSNSVALFATSYLSVSTNDGIYEYSVSGLTNLAFVKALPLTQNIPRIQGVVCVGGMLYVLADNGPSGEIYQVDPTNGTVVHLAQLNIAGNTEWEGLDYLNGFLVANEGATGTVNWYDFFGVQQRHIAGCVLDNDNHPIAGVRVTAAAIINGAAQMVGVDTDTNGGYSLEVTNGGWWVAVNCGSGTDSLANLGAYACPNVQPATFVGFDATVNFVVTNCAGISILTPSPLPTGEAGAYYNQTLQAFSCNPGFTWIQIGGSLPPGLSLTSGGILSGIPSGAGLFDFAVLVTDERNATTNQAFTVGVSNAVQILTTSLPDGSTYNLTLSAASGQPPYAWSLSPGSGSLPPYLSLATNGLFSGAAANSGPFSFSLRVTDSLGGFADQMYSINLISTNFPRLAMSAGGQIPFLAIGSYGNQTIIALAPSATNYVLQSTTNLASPDWQPANDAAPLTVLVFSNTPPARYFRLH